MKMENRSGGNLIPILICFFLTAIVFGSCQSRKDKMKELLSHSKYSAALIEQKYLADNPIAEIINVPVYTDTFLVFNVPKDGYYQIYATGELIYNLADITPEYFFKGDDIELFFNLNHYSGRDSLLSMVFSWADGKSREGRVAFDKYGTNFTGYQKTDSLNSKYLAQIKIPWGVLGVNPLSKDSKILFDVQIGDNDDEYKQKAKISLFGKRDHLYERSEFGKLLLKDERNNVKSTLISHNVENFQSDSVFFKWMPFQKYEIKTNIMGTVKDKYDLSATIRSVWDRHALFLFFEIQDMNFKKIIAKKVREMQSFLDYAWLEDMTGKTIWNMHALDSTPAGGAIKNRAINKRIFLRKGNYQLHYTSDESHAYNDWDDSPPMVPFYGVVVYQAK